MAIAVGGSADTTCTNGAWSNTGPTCVPACSAPPTSAVGAATATPNNPNNPETTQVTYTCTTGTLVGTAQITCLSTRAWSPAVAPDCVTNCPSPPSIPFNGAANAPATGPYTIGITVTYRIGTTVTYSCAANFDLKGSATNMCQRVGAAAAGTWTSTTSPTCVTADKDLDIVFILDGNNPLDDCTTKTSSTPVLAGPLLTTALFPNFFIQQALAAGIEAQWNTVNQGNTRIGYQMHAGVCDFASSTNLRIIKTLTSLSSTINLLSGQAYRCSTTNNPVKVVQCAQAVQFVAGLGDRPTIPNVIILVMHDTQKYTAAERATFLTEMAAARASLTGTLMITTALPPIDPNFSANEQYIRMLLACPATGSCLPFLGTMSNTANVVSNLKLATAGLK
uniref:Sushi domain-containing protein n=2 Tax=Ciona savignyi TaxID=51511 RepID=H2YQD6_CIOSA